MTYSTVVRADGIRAYAQLRLVTETRLRVGCAAVKAYAAPEDLYVMHTREPFG